MKLLSKKNLFWARWLIIACLLFCLAILSQVDSLKVAADKKQLYDTYVYRPFEVNHFTVGISPDDFEFFFSDPPRSFFSYQKAELVINRIPVVFRARMRIKGTHAWNWDRPKPSFRLRLKGQRTFYGKTTLDFLNPDDASMLANLIADNIACRLGLPSPRTTIATVNLNGDYKGAYHLAEPITPELLSRQGINGAVVVEGNLRNSKMWHHPELWEIQAPDEHSERKAKRALSELLALINTPVDLSKLDRLEDFIDFDGLASWSALMSAIGSVHTNDFLGNLLVYDGCKRKLFPVLSDSAGFGVITAIGGRHNDIDVRVPIYEFLTPLLNAAFRIPEFHFKRNRLMYKILQNELKDEHLKNLVNRYLEILRPLYFREKYATALINIPIVLFSRKIPVSPQSMLEDAERLLDFMSSRRKFILDLFDNLLVTITDIGHTEKIDGKTYSHILVQVMGHAPVKWDFSAMKGKIIADVDCDQKLDSVEPEFYKPQLFHAGLTETREYLDQVWLMVDRRWANFVLEPATQTYLLGISKDDYDECVRFLENAGRNAITDSPVILKLHHGMIDTTLLKPNSSVLHPWRKL
ncbi:MAG: hypothetical protein Kow0029_23040 [Candidatus Rifleibacteriota bacterium]